MIRNILASLMSAILFGIVGLFVIFIIDNTGFSTNDSTLLNTIGEMNFINVFSNSTLNGLVLLVVIVSIIIFIAGIAKRSARN